MVKQKILFDLDRFNRFKEDINVYEELLADVVNVFSAVLNLGVHSGASITRLIKHIADDCIENPNGNNCSFEKPLDETKNFQDINIMDTIDLDTEEDNDIDFIRFTNSGPVFSVSKKMMDPLKGSYIEEQRPEELRTSDGTIFLGYDGNDGYVYYLLDYLNGKKINFNSLDYEEQLGLLDLFEFCCLPIPAELVDCRERRDMKKKKYEENDEVCLYINNKKDELLVQYWKQNNNIWKQIIKNYDRGYVKYNHIENILYIDLQYTYINYIYEYLKNNYLDIPEEKVSSINKELLEKEMYSVFGDKGKEIVQECFIHFKVFKGTSILKNKIMEASLLSWLPKENKWKLLFRASEHEYKASEFHKYCDNKGETITLIKHIGHNNNENIFGGYTNQSWESPSSGLYKTYSEEFLFTLSNEHGIPPTKYDYAAGDKSYGIGCSASFGPLFGGGNDIRISNNCHNNSDSYCNASCYDEINTNQNNSLFVNTNNSKATNNFIIEDYEIWGKE
ncbi:hypothetical protein WA158_007876 [Blastocystis sp. Blastoise]